MAMTYAELILTPLDDVRAFAVAHPEHVGAQNAVAELERQQQARRRVVRHAKRHAPNWDAWSHVKSKPGRVPTKRDLR